MFYVEICFTMTERGKRCRSKANQKTQSKYREKKQTKKGKWRQPKKVLFAVEDNNMLQARERRGQAITTAGSSTQFILPLKKTGSLQLMKNRHLTICCSLVNYFSKRKEGGYMRWGSDSHDCITKYRSNKFLDNSNRTARALI